MVTHSGEPSVLDAPPPLVREVAEKLLDRQQTVAFAESCTGGRVSAMVTTYSGISSVFLGSIVSYSNDAKERLLGVSHASLQKHGAVSAQVAREMAAGARRALSADWAVSITGIAGPSGGSADKPVGLVFFGISGPGVEEVVERRFHFQGERTKIQQAAADHALSWLSHYLGQTPNF
ncbi:MAG: CinA family protein [Bdellovibrionaceae bacterium]|nr:CinA family protein [Pseudobdellovibrionaceae bacterium]